MPPPSSIPHIRENLVDLGGDLSPPSLLRNYRRGSFPWSVQPVTWWSPDPRTVIELGSLHLSRSLRDFLRKKPFRFTSDRAFPEVIRQCAKPTPHRPDTWITPEFIQAYTAFHQAGHAHSIECWQGEALVGGIYGVALGGYFAGESMFHLVSNASKAALVTLHDHLLRQGFQLFDVQMPTNITVQMGATFLPRPIFLDRLRKALLLPALFGQLAPL